MTADRVYRIDIAATPEAAWAAITEPDQVRRYYFDTAIRTDWVIGSPVEFVADDGEIAITGVLVAYDPPRSYAHTFVATWDGGADDQGTLSWTIDPAPGGCVVTLVHTGGHGEETAEGSQQLLAALKLLLEG